jgi:hypothetical protein
MPAGKCVGGPYAGYFCARPTTKFEVFIKVGDRIFSERYEWVKGDVWLWRGPAFTKELGLCDASGGLRLD